MNKYELGIACQTLYDFWWDDFCDWYIEIAKSALKTNERESVAAVLVYVLDSALKLLHPFAPFITDEIYRSVPGGEGSIMTKDYPRYNSKLTYKKDAQIFSEVIDVIKAVRALKVECGCPAQKKVTLYILTETPRPISSNLDAIERLAGAKDIKIVQSASGLPGECATKVLPIGTVYVPMDELVDREKELERLRGELEKTTAEIARADGKLNNQGFIKKAPKKLIDEEREKLDRYRAIREKLIAQIETLEKSE